MTTTQELAKMKPVKKVVLRMCVGNSLTGPGMTLDVSKESQSLTVRLSGDLFSSETVEGFLLMGEQTRSQIEESEDETVALRIVAPNSRAIAAFLIQQVKEIEKHLDKEAHAPEVQAPFDKVVQARIQEWLDDGSEFPVEIGDTSTTFNGATAQEVVLAVRRLNNARAWGEWEITAAAVASFDYSVEIFANKMGIEWLAKVQ